MFYKINPRLAEAAVDLAAEGFRTGDRLWVRLVGDFQPAVNGSTAVDEFQNTTFQIGAKTFGASVPTMVKAGDTTLLVLNNDKPLADNTDPDHDYGVRVKLAAFTAGADFFRFEGRDLLPDVRGSIYNSGAGDDVVVMPDDPVQGFDAARLFRTGAGDDRVKAGALDLKVDFGKGADTFVLKDAAVNWDNRENRDNDGTIVVVAEDGARHTLTNAEILRSGNTEDVLSKWYFDLKQGEDGELTVRFFENGKLVATGSGHYDEALPVTDGVYQASFAKGGAMGERVVLSDVAGGFGDVVLHKGNAAGSTQADFVVAASFLDTVFGRIEDAYDLAGGSTPWKQRVLDPLVPVTAAVRGQADQPVLKPKDLAVSDARDAAAAANFVLWSDGDVRGLDDKSVQVFFTATGSAERFEDWNFAGGVLRHGKDPNGDTVYSVMLEPGADRVAVPLRIIGDDLAEGTERVRFEVVDIDLWRHVGATEKLYRLSGGPGADSERDFDGPTGLENHLVRDTTLVVTIHDDLIG
jgi:hypothetical protein